MLTFLMLQKMKLFYEKNRIVETYTADPAYPIDLERFLAGFEEHRRKNALGSSLEKCSLIITDWSIKKDQVLTGDMKLLLCDLFKEGFAIYVWTGKLEQITSVSQLISKRGDIEVIDAGTVTEAAAQLEVPLLAKQYVILDYFKMRELISIMKAETVQHTPLDMNDVFDYLVNNEHSRDKKDKINLLIVSFLGRETIIADYEKAGSDRDCSGLFITTLVRAFPERIIIKNIHAREPHDDGLVIEEEILHSAIESIKFGILNGYLQHDHDSNIAQLRHFQDLENLKSIHLIYDDELSSAELFYLRPYMHLVNTLEMNNISSVSVNVFQFINLRNLNIKNTTASEDELISFLKNHQNVQKLKITGENNLTADILIQNKELLGKLETLKITRKSLIMTGEQFSLLLDACPKLVHLKLNVSSLQPFEYQSPALSSLHITGCSMTMGDFSQLLMGAPSLRKLNLTNVSFIDGLPSESINNFNVQHLQLKETQINAFHLDQLLQLFPQLNYLSIMNSTVLGDSAQSLFEGDCLAMLETFTINKVNISQEILEKLMKKFTRLEVANIEYDFSINDDHSKPYIISPDMVKAISSTHLLEVNLDFTRISIDDLVDLYFNNKNLQKLIGTGRELNSRESARQYSTPLPQLFSKKEHLSTNIISVLFSHTKKAPRRTIQPVPPPTFRLDTDTELPSQDPRDVMEYIVPHPGGINIHPRDYRESPFLITEINNGSVTINEYIPTDIKSYVSYKLIDNAKELYEEEAADDPRLYLAERHYVLNNKWRGLTSCSPYEDLRYLQVDAPVEIGFSDEIKKFYIRLQAPSEEAAVSVIHIFSVKLLPKIEKNFNEYTEHIDRCIHSLLYSPDGEYISHEYSQHAVDTLMSLDPLARAGALLSFYDGHPTLPDSGFKPGKLQGEFANDIELINAIKWQKLGRCELKTSPLYLDMRLLGVRECLIWVNDIHTYLEANINGTIYHMDPGGFPLNLNLVKPSYREEDEEMELSEPAREVSLKVLQQQKLESQSDLGKNNPFISWRKQGLPKEQKLTIDEYVSWLMQKADGLSDKRRNILVICEDSHQLELFNARLARYISLKRQQQYYYLSGYDSYSTSSVMITGDGYKKIPSQVVKFATSCTKDDAFCVNMSHIGTHYLWFIRLAEGHLGTHPLPQGLRLVMAIDKESLSNIGSELYRRVDLVETMPSFPEGDLYNLCVRPYDAEHALTSLDSAVHLYENVNAVETLKGEMHIDGEYLFLDQGPLIEAISSGAPGLCIDNAPFHLRAFRDFLINLCNTGRLYHNGASYFLPQPFYIEYYNAPYGFEARYSITSLHAENSSFWHYPLNHTTWNLFFKTYYCDPRTHLFQERPGWLAQASGRDGHMTILVTEDIPKNSWAEFLDTATKYNVRLQFIVPSDICIPDAMHDRAQQSLNKEGKGKEKNRQNNAVRLILTNDVDFTFEHQMDHEQEDVVYHVTEASKYSELFESFYPDDDSLKFSVRYGYILQNLLSNERDEKGKRVILKGRMSKEFAQHLESLFSENPYLYINGQFQKLSGELIIITDDKKSFPYFSAERFDVMQEERWDKLKEVFHEHQSEVQQLKEACKEIQQKTKINFTYIQLKTMMTHLFHHPDSNPFLPLLRIFKDSDEAIQISRKYFTQKNGKFSGFEKSKDKRMAKLCDHLAYSYYAFIVGESGTAKSTMILTQLLNFMERHIGGSFTMHVGLENIKKFTEEGGILFLDEANLKENGAYDIFENIFNDKPYIVVNGVYCPIDANHRIIFAGNFVNYAHRRQHDFFSRHGNVLQSKDLRDDYLLEDVLKPVFVSLFPNAPNVSDETHQRIMTHLLGEYRRINKLFPKPPLTPRNLQMMVLRFIAHAQQHDIDERFTIKQIMDLAINDELNGCTKQKDREGLAIWSAEEQEHLKACEQYLSERLDFKSNDYVLVPSRRNTLRLIYDAIRISSMKTVNAYGISGLLQEGTTTNGKSKIIIEALEYLGFVDGNDDTDPQKRHYYHITSSDHDEMLRIFTKAFHEGTPLIIDELNTLPFIEDLLNSFMSGTDLEGNRAQKPGFIVFATQNSIRYIGRDILSDAVHKRFTEEEVQDYTREDFIDIATTMGYEPNLVEQLVDLFLYAVNLAEFENVPQRPTLHHLLEILESYQPSKSRKLEVQSPDLFFSENQRKRKERDENSVLTSNKGKEKEGEKKQQPEKEEKEKIGDYGKFNFS
ncbi:hypothetical protein [Legionella fallonii]|uniref:Uncharacterized protein n=1 Tax=Legionella fallonii LLAP-10 TaxID=1212491 RepID=A0A098G4G9_9GAMM|nr:hypothetical protein [Legionella fallonii]CEG56866.1 protein of unknown function [F-box] [Legionella fallonii LLAP-10]